MKYITIIFSLYMTFLAFWPCRDSDDFGDIAKSYSSFTKTHSSEDSEKETCTPFCTCACCSIVRTVAPHSPVVTIFQQEVKQTYGEPKVPALLDQVIAIWQPPQLG